MDLFVVSPDWGWWIILYFYLGGTAAGAYFVASLIDLVGREQDSELARVGYRIAFPLVLACGMFLTVDLERPERFWHMLFKSEVVHEALYEGWPRTGASWRTMGSAILLKWWSPMSVGSWALTSFGFCSGLSFLGSLRQTGFLARVLRHGLFGRALQVAGCIVGFFVASYTGALLTATNQPLWSDSPWIAPLFLASAASTGISAILLLSRPTAPAPGALDHLERAEFWALVLELVVFGVFLVSLRPFLGLVIQTFNGKLLVVGTLLVGIVAPLILYLAFRKTGAASASILALLGGFVLRYALLTTPPEILARAPESIRTGAAVSGTQIGTPDTPLIQSFSPEDGRPPGGGPGADPGNKPVDLHPRSKVYDDKGK